MSISEEISGHRILRTPLFFPKEGLPVRNTDVLVIGGGAAGICAAVAAALKGVSVLLLTDAKVTAKGSSFVNIAGGWGIQALLGKERTQQNLENFYNEIIHSGKGVANPVLVRLLVEKSGDAISDLLNFGIQFKTNDDKSYLRVKGCFSKTPRAFLTLSQKNIRSSFMSILRRSGVKIVYATATQLLVHDNTCFGVICYSPDKTGPFLRINASSTILATGGGCGIFSQHMVENDAFGAGYSLAMDGGAELTNMEFIQFMLGMIKDNTISFLPIPSLGKTGVLIDENDRDILRNEKKDDWYFKELIKKRASHIPFSTSEEDYRIDLSVAIESLKSPPYFMNTTDETSKKVPVFHYAHAFNGGVVIDEKAQTSVEGLYAAGEVAAGPHGADRLGGCMMTATQVFGKIAGLSAAVRVFNKPYKKISKVIKTINPEILEKRDDRLLPDILEIQKIVKKNMSQYSGVLRHNDGLNKGMDILKDCQERIETLFIRNKEQQLHFIKTRNMIQTAKMIMSHALLRQKSLGSHFKWEQ